MKIRYIDFIKQTFDFPTEEFEVSNGNLFFHNIDLSSLIEKYGTPLKFTYLPKITESIGRVRNWFNNSLKKSNYKGSYNYCYCTKSSHFKYILDEVLKNNTHIETSSAYDIDIVENLIKEGKITPDTFVICNGFKRDRYIENISKLINNGHHNCLPIIDNYEEQIGRAHV